MEMQRHQIGVLTVVLVPYDKVEWNGGVREGALVIRPAGRPAIEAGNPASMNPLCIYLRIGRLMEGNCGDHRAERIVREL